MTVFRAYDIRGIYGRDLDEGFARGLGQAVAAYLASGPIIIGRDMRLHSPALSEALIDGLLTGGVEVIDLGQVSTPMCYFANGQSALRVGATAIGPCGPTGTVRQQRRDQSASA